MKYYTVEISEDDGATWRDASPGLRTTDKSLASSILANAARPNTDVRVFEREFFE